MKRFIAIICLALALSVLCSCQSLYETVAELNQPTESVEEVSSEEEIQESESILGLSAKEIRPALWTAEPKDGKGGKLYLFGSIHIGVEEMYPFDDRIEDAYNDSEAVAVEIDVISMEHGVTNMQEQYSEYLMYNDGTTLIDHISQETYAAVGAYLMQNHVSIYPYLGCKPYYLSEVVSSIKQQNSDKVAPFSSLLGVDRHYLTRAKLDGKQVLEVEDRSTRMKMYGDYSDPVQEYLLLSALYGEIDYDSSLELLRQWAVADLDAITAENEYEKSDAFQKLDKATQDIHREYMKGMMTDRNALMVEKAEEYLEKDMTVMYIVGCAHMVGEDGIVNQLEERGWKVTEIV